MAKLEEISEMLVSEIKDFEKSVKKLEKIQEAQITLNLTELKTVLSDHKVELKNQSSAVQQSYKQFENLNKEAKIYPKWVVILFIVSLVLNGLLISYLVLNIG